MKRIIRQGLILGIAMVIGLMPAMVLSFEEDTPSVSGVTVGDDTDLAGQEAARAAAEEYLEIVEEIHHLISDYGTYLYEVDDDALDSIRIALDRFTKGVEDALYATSGSGRLTADLRALDDKVKVQEHRLRERTDRDSRKLAQLLHSLSTDLTVIEYLIDEEIAEELDRWVEENREIHGEIEKYLSESLVGLRLAVRPPTRPEPFPRPAKKGEPPVPGTELPEVPIEPVAPGTIPHPAIGRQPGETGLVYESRGKVDISSEQAPIYVSLPLGRIIITGKHSRVASARLFIEVTAATERAESEFAEATTLSLTEDRNGYYIEAVLPRLDDLQTRILDCQMEVIVPYRSELICDNSFGEVVVSDLKADVTVKANYSKVVISDVKGTVRVENATGPVTLDNVTGAASVISSQGPIYLVDCRGEIVAENYRGVISLSDCHGRAQLINSGIVNVADHEGEVSIENSNGTVTALNINGDLTAFNSYQPLVTEWISGSAVLENSHGEIRVYQIGGTLEANNRYGDIHAEGLGGPVSLNTRNGSVQVVLNSQIRGESTITGSFGTIDIALAESSDLAVYAETEEGEIKSAFPADMKTDGNTRLARIRLGEGTGNLRVKGRHSQIRIAESE